jgi:hypothetical protein
MRKEINTLIIKVLKELNYSYTEVKGSITERVDKIIKTLDI